MNIKTEHPEGCFCDECSAVPPWLRKPREAAPCDDPDRVFVSGASRSADDDRYDPEAALSPRVLEYYCTWIHGCNRRADGSIRSDDNWQLGIPLNVYAKGLMRHQLHFHSRHRGAPVRDPKANRGIKEDLCAIIFNAQGYLHELLKSEDE